jgi:hypothetical protein
MILTWKVMCFPHLLPAFLHNFRQPAAKQPFIHCKGKGMQSLTIFFMNFFLFIRKNGKYTWQVGK